MPYYAVTVRRTLKIEADSAQEAEILAQLSTYYPETVDGVIHLTMYIKTESPDFEEQ